MILFLNNKWNFPSKSKIAHNSTNINKTNILTVLQNFFIHEKNNDIFKDTEILRDTVQINTIVQTGPIQCLIQSTAGADVASAARESGNSVTEDASSNILRLVKFLVPVGSLGSHSSIKKGNFSNLLLWVIIRDAVGLRLDQTPPPRDVLVAIVGIVVVHDSFVDAFDKCIRSELDLTDMIEDKRVDFVEVRKILKVSFGGAGTDSAKSLSDHYVICVLVYQEIGLMLRPAKDIKE